jgi:hypothetical protein
LGAAADRFFWCSRAKKKRSLVSSCRSLFLAARAKIEVVGAPLPLALLGGASKKHEVVGAPLPLTLLRARKHKQKKLARRCR